MVPAPLRKEYSLWENADVAAASSSSSFVDTHINLDLVDREWKSSSYSASPPSVSERIERLLNENSSSPEDLDLSFSEDERSGSFLIGNEKFPVSLLDLPCIMESYKTYDDSVLIKTADIGQVIMVQEEHDPAPEGVEYRHGLTPAMRDARRRRFHREPDLNPELVQRVEKDLLSIPTVQLAFM